MDKEQAIHSFWSSFGLVAYDELTVPDDARPPYITYGVSTGSLDDILILSGSLWYSGSSWKDITEKSHEIAEAVGEGGHLILKVDGGYLFLTSGTPFAQRMSDPSDDLIRRIYININAEFFTAY